MAQAMEQRSCDFYERNRISGRCLNIRANGHCISEAARINACNRFNLITGFVEAQLRNQLALALEGEGGDGI